jgi:uncharacterized protein DUF4167
MRGRNRNKGPNPLTRSYESNGPDVKIRGTAQHIAEKYSQLARDAQASGDPVAAENYYQHAEHYLRLIAAAQEQFRQQYGGYERPYDDEGDEDQGGFGYAQPGERPVPIQAGSDDALDIGSQPQPFDNRAENGPRPPRFDRGYGQERFDRGERGGRPERFERQDRRDRFQRNPASFEGRRPEGGFDARQDAPRQDLGRRDRRNDIGAGEAGGGLPAFLTNPARQSAATEDAPEADAAAPAESGGPTHVNGGDRPGMRPRRRRRTRYGEGMQDDADSPGFTPDPVEAPPAE